MSELASESSAMNAWNDLVSAALLGTQRRRIDPAGLPAAVRPLVAGAPEEALLRSAAVLANYRRAGHVPARPEARLPVAERDGRPLVPAAARRRLLRIPADLLGEWLQAVHEKGMRVPPEHLPALAEAARTRPALRPPLAAVAGPAGSWLGERNPAWAFLVSVAAEADRVWAYGGPLQRREWLDRTLSADPAAARTALSSTWAREPAGDRAEFLAVVGRHLDPADEPFLENALDDRAGQVRESAAELLARLPGSRLAGRMRERAGRLVQRDGERLAVALPDPDDAALLRDTGGVRHPAELLRRIVGATPLNHWAQDGTPEQVLARPVTGCDPGVLRAGWTLAAGRQRDAAWGAAVLAAADPASIDGTVTEMVRLLPAALHRPAVGVLAAKLSPHAMASAVTLLPQPWSPELGAAVLDWLAAHPGNRGLGGAARAAGRTVPTGCLRHPIATAPLPVGAAPWWRELATTLTFRREMHEELDT
ncbi:hypothetical protein FHX44_118264 [Pseudonocardia hierapolitana]|uniref:Uncharacterized protein n=2 Tax=Pseudonocardia hierapolitana TaxID=1128676 RepID=A0A561T5D9_9PSEU|nr:hypothetical protein FHX44_118264 [Pseudonocardia hierapolitana]